MIQRIQSVWFFIAALLCAGLFCFDLYRAHIIVNGADTLQHLRVNDNLPSFILSLILCLLPLIAIFLFKNRKQQKRLAILDIVVIVGFIALLLMRVGNFTNQTPVPTNGSYWIGAVLPILSAVFVIMAINGIRKDEKLVKSLDRLR